MFYFIRDFPHKFLASHFIKTHFLKISWNVLCFLQFPYKISFSRVELFLVPSRFELFLIPSQVRAHWYSIRKALTTLFQVFFVKSPIRIEFPFIFMNRSSNNSVLMFFFIIQINRDWEQGVSRKFTITRRNMRSTDLFRRLC